MYQVHHVVTAYFLSVTVVYKHYTPVMRLISVSNYRTYFVITCLCAHGQVMALQGDSSKTSGHSIMGQLLRNTSSHHGPGTQFPNSKSYGEQTYQNRKKYKENLYCF